MRTKNVLLTAISISILMGCKKTEKLNPELDYKKKLESEFKLTKENSLNKLNLKEGKPQHDFKTYEEAYNYVKELTKNTILYDTVIIYPAKTNTAHSNSIAKLGSETVSNIKALNNNNNNNNTQITGKDTYYYSRYISKSSSSSMSNSFTHSYSLATSVEWPWKQNDASSPKQYLGYGTVGNTTAEGSFLTYSGFMNMTSYNVAVSANGSAGTISGQAQLYASIGGFPNSISVQLSGSFNIPTPGSPESPLTVYFTFKAVEPTIVLP